MQRVAQEQGISPPPQYGVYYELASVECFGKSEWHWFSRSNQHVSNAKPLPSRRRQPEPELLAARDAHALFWTLIYGVLSHSWLK